MSSFSSVAVGPPIEVFAVNKAYLDDPVETKVNLSIGAYRTEDGKPWVLPVVRDAEKRIANDDSLNHEYLPMLGMDTFSAEASKLLLGDDSPAIKENRAAGIQCLSGTGSLRIAAEFLCKILKRTVYYVSDPTWENHNLVFRTAGFPEGRVYRYWDQANRRLDFEGMIADLESAPAGAVVILHGCAHNPTGMDPTEEQWKKIYDVIKAKQLFTFFDIA